MKQYPMSLKCALCGKTNGVHKAKTFECPVGLRGRANTYQYSNDKFFQPKAPLIVDVRLRQDLNRLVSAAKQVTRASLNHEYSDEELTILEARVARLRYAVNSRINDLTANQPSTTTKGA